MLTFPFTMMATEDTPSGTLWTPSDATTALWYDAADSGTITESSGAVSDWDDKSGNNVHLSQNTAADQPTTNANTLGGLNTIDFDSDFMDIDSSTAIKAAIWVSNNLNGSDSNSTVCIIYSATGLVHYTFVRTNNNDYDISIDGDGGDSGDASANGEDLESGTNINFSYNLSIADKAAPNVWYNDFTQNDITVDFLGFSSVLTDSKIKGDFGEVIFLSAIPSESLRQQFEGYLAWKWDGGSAGVLVGKLPSGHPYKSAAPTEG